MAKKESKGARAVINPDSKKEGGPDVRPIIIIKKVKKVSGGHHGGAWKVAYADFVTAMMAFFLLLWLLNVTTENQKLAISNFFDPTHPQIAESLSGAGGVMAGTTIATEGAMSSTMQEIRLPQNSGKSKNTEHRGDSSGSNLKSAKAEELKKELLRREDERFAKAKRDLERQIESTPGLAELKKHLMIDITPEGLRIQIVDQEGEPMFPSGSAQMFEKTKNLVTLAAGVIKSMPNNISVRGHTDSHQYKEGAEYTNWELSADRANATRRVIETAGIPNTRISNVMGKGDTEHLVADNPLDPKNRRISIILEREDLQTMLDREGEDAAETIGAPDAADEVQEEIDNNPSSKPAYKRTQGDIYFP